MYGTMCLLATQEDGICRGGGLYRGSLYGILCLLRAQEGGICRGGGVSRQGPLIRETTVFIHYKKLINLVETISNH